MSLSDEYLTLPGPRWVPIIKQGVRWKSTPMGHDAIGQWWYTGLTNANSRPAYTRWREVYLQREQTLPPAYNQRLRESYWYDPILPAQYVVPSTRWGSFLWQDKHLLCKDLGNWNHFGTPTGKGSNYVPFLSGPNRPHYTTRNFRLWNTEPYCSPTNQRSPSILTLKHS
ncbi:tektin bundle-interacting protein 1 isoform X2 [Macrotis lagotis]|uniref:tektin bundle-interacting protein 1 isoform X2 n=1 Tax=Macrotis lagotis TaxID=92651 RepID=UPI003D68E132